MLGVGGGVHQAVELAGIVEAELVDPAIAIGRLVDEAGLNFAVSKRRREARYFPGASRILSEIAGNLGRIRVGLFVDGAPARENTTIFDANGVGIGRVTSGGFSPSLNRAIALGFVNPQHAAPGTRLQVEVRGRMQAAEVTTLPFVPHRYVRKAST